VLDWLGELLFPSRCVGCQRRGVLLCEQCRRELTYLRQVCQRCALPRGMSRECRGCRRLSPTLVSLHAVCAYGGVARSAVHALKFRGGRNLAPLLGELLRDHIAVQPLVADLVVPVPISRQRHRERGYNQAELLAHQVAQAVGAPVDADLLVRQDRPAQQTLGAAERLVNLQGALQARRHAHGRVLLVDDVATTGATLSACADVLASAGARDIRALVFARDL
jgi:ComF family protein